MNMLQLFKPGDVIYGYCNGFFGRDDYEEKVCVFVMPKYAVFQYEDGGGTVLNYDERFANSVSDWKDNKGYE